MYIINQAMRNDFINELTGNNKYYYVSVLPHLSIKHYEDIKFSAIKLYMIGVPFDNQGKTRQERMESEKDIDATLTPFVEKIWKYFNEKPNTTNNQIEFDRFHDELCDLFLVSFESAGYIHTYGNAQKMVNMLFKYLTCYKDYERFAGLFNFCHIPIDRKILQDFFALNVPNTTRYGEYQELMSSAVTTPWTRMGKRQYYILVAAYRTALDDIKGGNSWLGMEYYIWAGLDIPTTGVHAVKKSKFYM